MCKKLQQINIVLFICVVSPEITPDRGDQPGDEPTTGNTKLRIAPSILPAYTNDDDDVEELYDGVEKLGRQLLDYPLPLIWLHKHHSILSAYLTV